MGNKNYIAGRRFEYETLKELKALDPEGFGGRLAGSHGKYDVVWVSPKHRTVYLIQCKTNHKISFPKKINYLYQQYENDYNINCQKWTKYLGKRHG